jgi:hypothetical protein
MVQISWNPPLLDHQDCSNIDGKYKVLKIDKNIYTPLSSTFPQSINYPGPYHVNVKIGKTIPGNFVPRPQKNFPKAGFMDESEFYDTAFVLVRQNQNELTVSLMSNNEEIYKQLIIDLNSPMMGCVDGYLVLRWIDPPGASERGYGSTYATERRYKKLADGSLQVMSYQRKWAHYDDMLGLSDLEEGRGMLIFPSVP